jgi:hypothetical protein
MSRCAQGRGIAPVGLAECRSAAAIVVVVKGHGCLGEHECPLPVARIMIYPVVVSHNAQNEGVDKSGGVHVGIVVEENSGRLSLSAPQNRDRWHKQGLMMMIAYHLLSSDMAVSISSEANVETHIVFSAPFDLKLWHETPRVRWHHHHWHPLRFLVSVFSAFCQCPSAPPRSHFVTVP